MKRLVILLILLLGSISLIYNVSGLSSNIFNIPQDPDSTIGTYYNFTIPTNSGTPLLAFTGTDCNFVKNYSTYLLPDSCSYSGKIQIRDTVIAIRTYRQCFDGSSWNNITSRGGLDLCPVTWTTPKILYSNIFNTTELMSLTTSENATRYLKLPSTVSALTHATFNLTGFVATVSSAASFVNSTFYYTLNSTTGAVAFDSVGKYNGTFNSAPIWMTGKIGNAANVTGTQYLNTTFTPGTSSFSISFWMNTSVGSGTCLVGDSDGGAEDGFYICTNTNRLALTVFNTVTTINGDLITPTISDSLWHHVILTYNTTDFKAYTDGVSTYNKSATIGASPNQLYFFARKLGNAPYKGLLDEIGYWNNLALSTTDVNQLYNSGAGISYKISTDSGNTTLDIGSNEIPLAIATNGTSELNISITGIINAVNNYISTCPIINQSCYVPFMFSSTTNGTLRYYALQFDDIGFLENSQTFNANTFEGRTETFILNMTYDSGTYSSFALLNYNGINYTGTSSGTGNNILFSKSLTVPGISTATKNNSFYWIIGLTNSTGTTYYLSTFNNQTVSKLSIDNCTAFSDRILTSYLKDEDTRASMPGTIETLVNIFSADHSTLITSFNNSIDGFNSSVCFQAGIFNTTNYTMDYQIKYFNATYSNEYVNAENILLANASIPYIINLYDLVSTNEQDCQITYRDRYLIPAPGVILSLQRQYLPINAFLQVEAPKTDNNGQVILHFARNNPVYNVIAISNGTVVSTQSNVQLSTVSTACQLSLNEISSNTNLGNYNSNFNLNGAFNLTSNSLSFIFTSLDGTPVDINWNVVLNDGYGNTTICTNSQVTASGTLLCSIPTVYLNSSVLASVNVNGQHYTTQGFTFGPESSAIFGGVRVLLMMMMYITITLLFISHPIGIVFGAIFGMSFAGLLLAVDGLNILNIGSIILWFVVAGGLIIWRLSKSF